MMCIGNGFKKRLNVINQSYSAFVSYISFHAFIELRKHLDTLMVDNEMAEKIAYILFYEGRGACKEV